MSFPSLAGFLLAGLICQQVGRAAMPPAAAEKTPDAEVGPDDPVITLDGFCRFHPAGRRVQHGNHASAI